MIDKVIDKLSSVLLSKIRIDHNPMYMCMMVWDLFAGIFAVSIGLPDAAMTHMTPYSQKIICWLMFLGGAVCVTGICLGTKLDVAYWARSIFNKNNIIDLRIPYILGVFGTPMLMVSFFYYSVAIFIQMPWVSTQTSEASFALFFGIGCTLNFMRFILEIHNINVKLPGLIAKEIQERGGQI
jgi:hypothetical protein